MRASSMCCVVLLAFFLFAASGNAAPVGFLQTNLVSDIPGLAKTLDPDLKNPWGISASPTSPFWVADNGTGVSTLYNGQGGKLGLVVSIPPGSTSAPTGTVFNGNQGAFLGDRFLFATENGAIDGWQPASATNALVRVDNSGSGAVYKGLAIENDHIFATDFANNKVDVFDANYAPTNLGGAFTDPNLPAGYAPFGIRSINGDLYVTYALKKPGTNDDQAGPGFGFVDRFDTNGVLLDRVISQGNLNSPWGLALAPLGFAAYGGKLLVGNFGDGAINVYELGTGAFIDTLHGLNGNPLTIDGLWALQFGNGGAGFDPARLYFTAGLNDEVNGLFGSLQPVPEPGTLLLAGGAVLSWLAAGRRRGRRIDQE